MTTRKRLIRPVVLAFAAALSLPGKWGCCQTGNSGFESNSISGWTNDGTGTATVQNSAVRTGTYAGHYVVSSSVNQRWRNDGNSISVPNLSYVHYIVWVNPTAISNSLSAGINLNGNFAATGSTKTVNTWTQISYSRLNSSGTAVTAWGYVNTNNGGSGTVANRIDDGVLYVSSSSAVDLTRPLPASNFTVTTIAAGSVSFTWTNGSDAGTGVQATLILRTADPVAAGVPVLNDQGVYSTAGGINGPNTITDANHVAWTVVSTTVSTLTSSYTDASVAPNTSYTYAIVHRDLAFNYSPALLSTTITTPWSVAAPVVTTGSASSVGTSTATLNGVVNANNGTTDVVFAYGPTIGYGSHATAAESPVSGSVSTAVTAVLSGLAANTLYYYMISGSNSAGRSDGANAGFSTLAYVPSTPILTQPAPSSLNVAIGPGDGNPSGTFYAIQEITTGGYVQADGLLGSYEAWLTAAGWGEKPVSGLTSQTTYTFRVKAKNFDEVETAFSAPVSGTTLTCSSPPTDLLISNITNSGVAIRWTGDPGTELEYAVITSSTPPISGTAVTSSTSEFVSGLLSATTYFVHVRTKCGTRYSAWVTSEPFSTASAPEGLVTWVPVGQINFGTNPFPATTADARVVVSGLTRGVGVLTGNQVAAAANAWGGYGWEGAANQDVEFTITAAEGYRLSLESLQLSYRISATGPTGCILRYAIDNGGFVPVATLTFQNGSAGNSIAPVPLGSIAALQNLAAGTSVTFQLLPTGGQPLGTWYLFNEGLVVNGTMATTLPAPIAGAAGPVSAHCFTANWSAVPSASGYFIDVYKDGFSLHPNPTTLAGWTFKNDLKADSGIESNTGNPITAAGTAGLSLSSETARADGWQGGSGTKFWETSVCTTGFYNLKLSSKQRSSTTGPRDFKIQYKIGATGTYTDVPGGVVPALADNYTSGAVSNLPLPSACENQALVFLRCIMTSNTSVGNATVGPVGASNLDDLLLTGNAGMVTTSVTGYTNLPTGDRTSLDITGLPELTKYYYVVRAEGAGLRSLNSNVVTVTTLDHSTANYRSKRSGHFSDATTWEYDPGCGVGDWVQATSPPASGNRVTVQGGHTVVQDVHSVLVSDLTLQAGAVFSLSDHMLTVNGGISGAGSFLGSSGSSLIVNGGSGTIQFLQSSDGASNALGSLTVAGGFVTLGNRLHVYDVLSVSGGKLDLNEQSLVLKSTAEQTARVAEIRGILTGASNVTVERYLSASGGSFNRLLTAPVEGTSINAAWQEGRVFNGSVHLDYLTKAAAGSAQRAEGTAGVNYGTLINGQKIGDAATANSKGFDFWSAAAGYNATIRYYVPNAAGTQAPANTSFAVMPALDQTTSTTAFNQCQAYMLWIWGPRSQVPPSGGQSSVTLRAKGGLKQGPYTVNVPGDKAYALVGNPYAAPLDFKSVYDANSANIRNYFWVWLPTASNYNVLVSPTTGGAYEYIPAPLSPTGTGGTVQNRVLHSAEGFFVVPATSSTTNQITIQERHKADITLSAGIPVMRQQGREDLLPAKLYVNLSKEEGSEKVLLDGGLARYSAAYTAADDVAKLPGSAEKLALPKEGRELIVASAAQLPRTGDTLALKVTGTAAQRSYLLEVLTQHFSVPGLSAVLVDRYLQKEVPLSLQGAVTPYRFTVNGEAASRDPLRFYILFRALPLPVVQLDAQEQRRGVDLQWSVGGDALVAHYELERSSDGATFTKLATQAAAGTAAAQRYQHFDAQPAPVADYRVKVVGVAGTTAYSNVVRVVLQQPSGVVVYPNPVSGGTARVLLTNKAKGRYTLTLYNSLGQPVVQQVLQHPGGTQSYPLPTSQLIQGAYTLQVSNRSGGAELILLYVVR